MPETSWWRPNLRNDFKDSEIADLNVDLAKAHAEQGHVNEAMASLVEAIPLTADLRRQSEDHHRSRTAGRGAG